MLDLEKAHFGIKMWDMNRKEFRNQNLFGSCRVLDSIAIYKTRKYVHDKYTSVDDVVHFCFGDTRGRVQYEMGISEVFSDDVKKADVYTMYVEPNKKLLYDMVQEISVASCKRWMKKSTRLSRPARSTRTRPRP